MFTITADPLERRLINLAIYLMLLVSHPDTIESKRTALYAQLVPLARQLAQEAAQERQKQPQTSPSPGTRPKNGRGPVFRGRGSQSLQMAGSSGRRANPGANLDRLIEALMEPVGRKARQRAAKAIQRKRD